jgi:hypothetical protein
MMKIFKIYYEATIGAAYVRAESREEASNKLNSSIIGADLSDVRFDFWPIEPKDGMPEGNDLEELDEEGKRIALKIMFHEED